jgi:Flp pilus assembly pilin Flp
MSSLLKKLLTDEGGLTTVEWLVITFLGASGAYLVVSALKPELANTHNNVINNITGVVSSGF